VWLWVITRSILKPTHPPTPTPSRADEIRAQLWPPDKPILKHYLALVYLDMGNTTKAIELFELTYKILIEQNSTEHAGSFRTLSCLATAYSHHGALQLSLEKFERVLIEQQKYFPEGHPDIGITLHHMGSNFWRMKNYERAMECYRNSVSILKRFMHTDHFEIALVKQKIQRLEQEQQNRL
jgi:tetratricopeptide (TPR) repeat protein